MYMLNPATKALNTDIRLCGWRTGSVWTAADSTSGLQALDDYTVQITLRRPYAPFIAIMASPQASIFNKTFTEAVGANLVCLLKLLAAQSPFMLKEYVLNDYQTLAAEKYYRGRPKLDDIMVCVADAEDNASAVEIR